VKFTWQAHPSWRAVASYSDNDREDRNINASRWVMPEARAVNEVPPTVIAAELSSCCPSPCCGTPTLGVYELNDNLYPLSGDLQTIGHYNYVTGWYTHNFNNQQYLTSRRSDLATDLTWFR